MSCELQTACRPHRASAREQGAVAVWPAPKRQPHSDGLALAKKIVTVAGVSASADVGLFLTREIAGQQLAERIQLGIEYYPDPPFGPKTVDEASAEAKAQTVDFEQHGERILASRPRQF